MSYISLYKVKFIVPLIYAFVVFFLYGNSIQNGFVADDVSLAEHNELVHSVATLPQLFYKDCSLEIGGQQCQNHSLYYRPLRLVSYLVTWQISSKPWVFHAVQLGYVIVAAYLVYCLAYLLTKRNSAAFWAGLLFLAHPINSEVAIWISAAPDVLMAIFILLTVITYARGRIVFAYIWYALALLSKEPAVLLPIVLIVFDYLLRERRLMRAYLPFASIAGVYILVRQAVVGMPLTDRLGDGTLFEHGRLAVVLFARYVGKVFWPHPLEFFPDIRRVQFITNVQLLCSLAIFFALVGLLIFLIGKKKNQYAFLLAWFAIFLIPVLVYAEGVGPGLVAERYLFVPIIGVSIAFGSLIARGLASKPWRHTTVLAFIACVIIFPAIIWPRVWVWRDNDTFIAATLAQNPNAHELRFAVAQAYANRGQGEAAQWEYEEILRRDPHWAHADLVFLELNKIHTTQLQR